MLLETPYLLSFTIYGGFCIILSLVIFCASYALSKKAPEKNKLEGFECGFNSYGSSLITQNVSIRFYLICVLFLIFECESWIIVLFIVTETMIPSLYIQIVAFVFIILLYAGLVYEWVNGGLEWK